MIQIVLLVLFFNWIETGCAVRLTNFEPIKTEPYMLSFRNFKTGDILLRFDAVYANETLFYTVCDFIGDGGLGLYVSATNLTSLTTNHRRASDLPVPYPAFYRLFVANNRVFIMFALKRDNRLEMTNLLVWDNDRWRPLNGQFPYVLGYQKDLNTNICFESNLGPPDVVYISSGCCISEPHRYYFHRLEVIGDRAVIEHIASFPAGKFEELTFFTVWNGMLIAFVAGSLMGVKKYTMPIPDQPLVHGENSSFVVIEPVHGLVSSEGFQIDRFVVFTGGFRHGPGLSHPDNFCKNATILDLDSMQITDTDVPLRWLSHIVVDEEKKRLFWIVKNEQNKVATLLT